MEQLEEKVHELFATCKNKSPCLLLQEIKRYGLTVGKSPDVARYNLRTLTEFGTQFLYNKYKGKEEIALSYFSSLNRTIKKEEIRNLLSYVPQRFLELFKVI